MNPLTTAVAPTVNAMVDQVAEVRAELASEMIGRRVTQGSVFASGVASAASGGTSTTVDDVVPAGTFTLVV